MLLKLFAVTDPRRFLPIFPLTGPMGKIAVLRRFGLAEPDGALSRGQQHVEANDRLRATLEQSLSGDPWGQGQFAYWMLNHDAVEPVEEEDRIARTAQDLLLPELFLRELAELLHEKGNSSSTALRAPARPTWRTGSPRLAAGPGKADARPIPSVHLL